jgi:predicted transposase YdaD
VTSTFSTRFFQDGEMRERRREREKGKEEGREAGREKETEEKGRGGFESMFLLNGSTGQ